MTEQSSGQGRTERQPTRSDPDGPIRVLLANDHHGWGGTTLHGIGKLFLLWLPRFDPSRCRVVTCIMRRKDPLDSFFAERGIEVTYFGRHRFSPLTLLDYLRTIRRERIDVLHLQGYASWTFGRLASAITGVPVVLQCHSVDPRYRTYMSIADRFLASRTDRCLTLCESVRRFVIERQHIAPDRIESFPLGIDLEEFEPRPARDVLATREALGIPARARVVGTMTRLFEQKGNTYFLEAASLLARSHPDAVFLVVGEGPLRGELEAQAKRLGLTGRARFLGFRKDAPAVLSTFDVAVLSSLWEATPLTAYEAMAMGKPIVSTEVDGLGEILEAEATALLVPPRNPQALAREIGRVLDDSALADRLGRSALSASRRFDVHAYVRRLEGIYEEVAREGRVRREGRRRRWALRVRLVLTVVLLLALLSQIDLRSVFTPLESAAAAPLLAALGLVAVDRAVMAWKWHLLLAIQPIASSFRETLRIFFTGNFIGLFLPLGIGSDLARAAGLGVASGRPIEAVSSIVVERALGLLSLASAALVGLAVAPPDALPEGVRTPTAIVLGSIVIAGLAGAAGTERLHRWATRARWSWVRRLAHSLDVYRARPGLLAAAFALSLLVQGLRIGIVFALALALGQSLPLASFLFAVPVTTAASLLPVTLGGFGAREGVYWLCFTRLGVPGGVAVTLGLLSFVAAFVGALPGAFFLLSARGTAVPIPRPRSWARRLGWGALRAVGVLAVVGLLVFAGLIVSPGLRANLPWSKREAFERGFVRGSLLDRRVFHFSEPETLRVPSQGLDLVASFEPGAGADPRPAIVFIHGSVPQARNLGLYRLLRRRLAEAGFSVLSPDLAGFGDSPDPPDSDRPEALDGIEDVRAAVRVLSVRPEIDKNRIALVGHSMGGSIALREGLSDSLVSRVVAIGPSRRSLDKIDSEAERASFLLRFRRDRKRSAAISWDVVSKVIETHRVERAVEPLRSASHKPVLFLDGGLESEEDRASLASLVAGLAPPVRLFTVPNADHYLNTLGLGSNERFVISDRRAVDAALAEIVRFLEEP